MESSISYSALYDPESGARLLTLQQAAKYLDYHPYSVYRLVSQGVLKPQKIGGKTLVFLQEALDRYRESNEWAARKAGVKHEPSVGQGEPPTHLAATLDIDLGLGSPFTAQESMENFSFDRLPLIKAGLEQKYGKKMKSCEITVNGPDGWTWRIKLEPPRFHHRIREYFKKGKRSKGRQEDER